ncbi:hypothetical protein HMPREF3166_06060 [Corynebacterium sp. HMSC08A12]|uniref:hypothetical protein n=1 Tax=Corynebacterium sp. HMSC08A12 TaxID=1581134 RepID=UPI0008A4AD25|nr:hypothetical protein [Corynebacterium sp. HMSC08A12]OFT34235.1 hypothetical protein HMPREF3166_06060 [Corynebacterium sp. HMSC08A12]
MRNRLVALSVAALTALSLAACSDDENPPEQSAAQSSKESGETSAEGQGDTSEEGQEDEAADNTDNKAQKRPNPTAPSTPKPDKVELAPNETALEGELMKVHFSDMTPPEDFARVADIVDDSVVYYAIKLDPKKPVTAKLGAGIGTQTPEWAIVGSSSMPNEMNWDSMVGRNIRAIAHRDNMTFATDPSAPPTAVTVENSDYKPEILD